jgi:dihydrofolate reductase
MTSSHTSLESALSSLPKGTHRTFLIGGSQLYSLALDPPSPSSSSSITPDPTSPTQHLVDRILLTRVLTPFACDTFLTDFAATGNWRQANHDELQEWVGGEVQPGEVEEKGVKYRFEMWVRV